MILDHTLTTTSLYPTTSDEAKTWFGDVEEGIKVGEDLADVSNPIVFNAQIPHEAWNQTSQDWLSLLIYINNDTFKKEQ